MPVPTSAHSPNVLSSLEPLFHVATLDRTVRSECEFPCPNIEVTRLDGVHAVYIRNDSSERDGYYQRIPSRIPFQNLYRKEITSALGLLSNDVTAADIISKLQRAGTEDQKLLGDCAIVHILIDRHITKVKPVPGTKRELFGIAPIASTTLVLSMQEKLEDTEITSVILARGLSSATIFRQNMYGNTSRS